MMWVMRSACGSILALCSTGCVLGVLVLILPAVGSGKDASGSLAWSRGGVAIPSYAFATLDSGSHASTTFRLTNWGRHVSGKFAIHLTGSSAFSIKSNRCTGRNLNVRQWCRVTVVYAPSEEGARDRAVLTATREHRTAAKLTLSGCSGDASGHVYWVTDTVYGTVNKTQFVEGCLPLNTTTLVTGEEYSFPHSVAVDSTHVYWGSGDGTVKKVPISGGTVTTLASGQGAVPGLAVDGTHVYWVSFHSGYWDDGTVKEVPISGGSVTTLASDQGRVSSLAVDATHVYWANLLPNDDGPGAGTLSEVPVGGGAVTTLASGQGWPGSVAVDGTYVYWTSQGNGTVNKIPVGGGTVTALATGQGGPTPLAVDSTRVYWVNYNDGTVNSVPLGGGAVTTLASGQSAETLAVDGTHVYWTGSGALKEVPVGGGAVNVVTYAGYSPALAVGP